MSLKEKKERKKERKKKSNRALRRSREIFLGKIPFLGNNRGRALLIIMEDSFIRLGDAGHFALVAKD